MQHQVGEQRDLFRNLYGTVRTPSVEIARAPAVNLSSGMPGASSTLSLSTSIEPVVSGSLASLSNLMAAEAQGLTDEQRSIFNKRVLQLYREVRQTAQQQQVDIGSTILSFQSLLKTTNKKSVCFLLI